MPTQSSRQCECGNSIGQGPFRAHTCVVVIKLEAAVYRGRMKVLTCFADRSAEGNSDSRLLPRCRHFSCCRYGPGGSSCKDWGVEGTGRL